MFPPPQLKAEVSSSPPAFHLVMHSYHSSRLLLCPVAGGHLCFLFAGGAFRVIGWGLVGLAAGGMLGRGARRGGGAGGVGRLDVLLV